MNTDIFSCLLEYFNKEETVKLIFSDSDIEIKKIIIKPILLKDDKKWQLEKHIDNKAFHVNMSFEELLTEINHNIINHFKQVNIINKDSSVQLFISSKGKITINTNQIKEITNDLSHNRVKNYIFNEGDDIIALRDLGIFTQDNKIVKSKFNKYKQINRFIEIINDEFKTFEKDELTIMDFGCGKSYLTFLIYYYFKYIKKINVKIFGYDIKQDVVNDCNEIAKKYGYTDLEFINADIADQYKMNRKVDMIITLHACDIATDYALFNAIKNNIKYIFSVPCCQHEINSQIKTSIEASQGISLLLNDGLIKERFSALLTDSIRCEILRQEGYTVDVVEFVDFDHSSKNLMIRAKLNKNKKNNYEHINTLLKQFNCKQKLFSLITGIEHGIN